MRVAVIIDTWFPLIGGGQINAFEISKVLAQSSVSVDIITRNSGRFNLGRLPKNLKIILLGKKSSPYDQFAKVIFLFRSFFFILKNNYDLVHAHAFLPGLTVWALKLIKKVPTILTVHGTSINTKLHNFFKKWFERFILTQIKYSAQITVSQDFLKISNVNRRVIYISNGVDIKKFDRLIVKKLQKPTLIFVGRFHKQKNLETLLQAIFQLKLDGSDVSLLLVGEGREKQNIRKLIQTLKLKKMVKIIGKVSGSKLVKFYKSSHLFILPSIYEGQPLTFLEAWAAKLPVVVTNTGDCSYLVKNDQNGYLINDPYSPLEIAQIIKKALSNKNLNRLGEAGYNLVKSSFSWEKSAQKTMEVYQSVTKS